MNIDFRRAVDVVDFCGEDKYGQRISCAVADDSILHDHMSLAIEQGKGHVQHRSSGT